MGLISRVSSRTYRGSLKFKTMVRVKRRHILFKINPTDQSLPSPKSLNVTEQEIYNSIRKSAYQIHGTIGGAKATQNFKVKYINVYTEIGYVSSLHQYHKKVLSSMCFVNSIGSVSGTFHTLHISGTIKGCQKYLAKFHKRSFEKICKDFSGLSDAQKEIINNSIKCELQDEEISDNGDLGGCEGDGMLID